MKNLFKNLLIHKLANNYVQFGQIEEANERNQICNFMSYARLVLKMFSISKYYLCFTWFQTNHFH